VSAAATTSLYLLRHAHAGQPEAWEGDDAARPLSDKGVAQSERLALHLSLAGFQPDLILTSPKLRALQTAQIVASALGLEAVEEERLAGSLDPGLVEQVVRNSGGPRRPVLVGHDPDFSELLMQLTGAPRLEMKKGALARIDLPSGFESGSGLLRWLLPPDLLPPEG